MSLPNTIKKSLVRCPLWSLMMGVILGIITGEHLGITWWPASLALGIVISLLFRKLHVILFLTGIIVAYGTHGSVMQRQQIWLNSLDPEHQTLHLQLEGVVIATGSKNSGPYLIKIASSLAKSNLPPGVRIQLPSLRNSSPKNLSTAPLSYGDIVSLEGNLTPVPAPRNPHSFDRAAWLHRQGVDLNLALTKPVKIISVDPLRIPVRTMDLWRLHLRDQMTSGLDTASQEAQLIRAVVLGERPPQPSPMLEDFRHSGTLHVFAVSGLHVGMVGTIVGMALWFLRMPRWLLITLTILSMAAYAGITGLRPPSVRAVLMATVFLSGFLLQRRPSLINSLAASAVVVLLLDGHQLFTPGFQLSYGVLATLALLAGMWSSILQPLAQTDAFLPRQLLSSKQERWLNARTWLKNSLSISLAAWMGSAPLMWIHFGIITPIAIIAGIPLMVMVFLILAMTILSVVTGALWQPLSSKINQTNALLAKGAHHTAAIFADLPGSYFYRSPSSLHDESITVFDLPYGGGASFINLGGGILLDCGKKNHLKQHVIPTITALKNPPDSFIISHAEIAHSGGMAECLKSFNPKQALIPRTNLRSVTYQDFLKKSKVANCLLVIPQLGQTFKVEPGVHIEVLHAPIELDGYGRADDSGLVIRLHWHDWRILFTGDAGFLTENRMLESGLDLHSDVIVMGRNTSGYSGTKAFIQAVSPQAIISSHVDFPQSEQIPQAWRAFLQEKDIILLDQKITGAVTLTLAGKKLRLIPTLNKADPVTLSP